MKEPDSKHNNLGGGGTLRKIYRIFHKVTKETANHPVVACLMFVFTIWLLWIGIRSYKFSTGEQPLEELRSDITKTIIDARIKIVYVSEGCHATNTYSQSLEKNNSSRLDIMSNLAAIADAGSIEKNLGKKARDQVSCFIKYNDMLNIRANICDGPFLTEEEMKKWEKEILYDINHKSDKRIKCSYLPQ